ncbi:hypothetical protein V6N11_010866 [Hibiscus sabdariffa]|uniref:Uncharacterized protein n=1 Tax=Hibiscus sabdariffa TaxID=183260 RepID=A0ABR2S7E5_9ROSI
MKREVSSFVSSPLSPSPFLVDYQFLLGASRHYWSVLGSFSRVVLAGNRLSWLPSTWFFELIPLIWSMTVLAWNVRGMGNKDTIRALRNSIQKFQSNIVFLSETKQKKRYLEKIKMKMKFTHCHYEDPCGLAWGLALWWSDDTQITILRSGKHFIDAMSSINGDRSGTDLLSMDRLIEKRNNNSGR